MAVENERGNQAGGDDSESTGFRDQLSPARQQAYDDVLSGLEAGEDESGAKAKPAKGSPKTGGAGKAKAKSAPPPVSDDADDDDLTEADLEGLDDETGLVDEDAPKSKKPKAAPSKEEADDEDDDDDLTDPDEDDEDDDAEADDDEPEDSDDEDDESVDVELKKRTAKALKAVAAAEKRSKEADRERRTAFERDKADFIAEWKPQVQKAQAFAHIEASAAKDPIGTLLELGSKLCKLDGDDWENAAKAFFRLSPKAATQPGARDAAARAQAEVATRAKQGELERELHELKESLKQRDAQEEAERSTRGYLNRVIGSVTQETPLARRLLRKSPEAARRTLHELAAEMAEETGVAPKPAALLRRLEKLQRQQLRAIGIDPDRVVKRKTSEGASERPGAKSATNATGKKKPAARQANGKGKPLSGRELREDVERNLTFS